MRINESLDVSREFEDEKERYYYEKILGDIDSILEGIDWKYFTDWDFFLDLNPEDCEGSGKFTIFFNSDYNSDHDIEELESMFYVSGAFVEFEKRAP